MVTLHNGSGGNDWRAWALNITMAIISALMLLGIANLTSQMTEIRTDLKVISEHNHVQDLCIKELQINQNERLRREGK